jgi:hypothetical protein
MHFQTALNFLLRYSHARFLELPLLLSNLVTDIAAAAVLCCAVLCC